MLPVFILYQTILGQLRLRILFSQPLDPAVELTALVHAEFPSVLMLSKSGAVSTSFA